MKLSAIESADEFLKIAGPFLQARESQNGLPLGLALRTRANPHDGDEGTRFFTLEHAGLIEGAVLQTPGHPTVFTDMSEGAAKRAAAELPQHLPSLVGCVGPVAVVDLVAEEWQTAGLGTLNVLTSMRLFELVELTPARPAPGVLRLAVDGDFELCQRWLQRFLIESHLPQATPGELPERVIALEQRRQYLWEVDGAPVACAGWQRPTSEGISIGYVYTPDVHRGRGYASNVVGALTAGLLDGSLYQPARRRVNLFTDLDNPTSNSIYRKLGYQPIGDHRRYMFEGPGA